MFAGPDPLMDGVVGHALDVAVAQAPHGRIRRRIADEGVVGGNGAVVVDADHLAQMAGRVLGLVADQIAIEAQGRVAPVADGDQQGLIRQPEEPGAEVLAAALGAVHLEDHPPVAQRRAIEAGPGHPGAVGFLAAVGIAEVEPAVV